MHLGYSSPKFENKKLGTRKKMCCMYAQQYATSVPRHRIKTSFHMMVKDGKPACVYIYLPRPASVIQTTGTTYIHKWTTLRFHVVRQWWAVMKQDHNKCQGSMVAAGLCVKLVCCLTYEPRQHGFCNGVVLTYLILVVILVPEDRCSDHHQLTRPPVDRILRQKTYKGGCKLLLWIHAVLEFTA